MIKLCRGDILVMKTVRYCDVDSLNTTRPYIVREGEEDEYFLLMFFKTNFIYLKDGKKEKGEKFHYLLSPPNVISAHGRYDEPFKNDWIFFRGERFENIIKEFNLPFNTAFYIDDHSIIFPYIKEIATEQLFTGTCYEEKIDALVSDMLIDLGRKYENKQKTKNHFFEEINKARNYMLSNLDKKIALEEIAQRANYSLSRFCILYKRFFKITPIEDLTRARIEKAITLMQYNHISVTEASQLCGFSSIHYFSRKFKEKTGMSPTKFCRNKNKSEN